MSQTEFLRQFEVTSLPIPFEPAIRRDFQPVKLEGEPLSETIIRERR